jgi:hypothetical protein
VIPTMILFGLLLGRWWKTALGVGTASWAVLLWTQGLVDSPAEIAGAAALALANTAVGVMAHRGLLVLVRRVRRPTPHTVGAGH